MDTRFDPNRIGPARRKFLAAWLLAFVIAPAIIGWQVYNAAFDPRAIPAGRGMTADDTAVGAIVKYVGSSASGTITVSAAGDLTFKSGAEGGETATSQFKCPSGGSDGVIDVSDADCNTLGEIADVVNASTNFRFIILDGLRSDDANCGGSGCFAALSEIAATAKDGRNLVWDTDVALHSTIAVLPPEMRKAGFYLSQTGASGDKLRPDPFAGYIPSFFYGSATSTYGSGTSLYALNCVRATYNSTSGKGTESVTTVGGMSGGATTALKEFTNFIYAGMQCGRNEKLVARLTNSAAMASTNHYAYGKLFPVPTR